MVKCKVLLLGKLPPPYYGPAIATEILMNSKLKDEFHLIHLDTRLNTSMHTMGKVSFMKIIRTIAIYFKFVRALSITRVKLVLIPIAQETSALMKDAVFIALSRLCRKKVILHLRGSALLEWYNNRNRFLRLIFKWIFSLSSGAIVLGNKLRYIFEPFLSPDKIFVVPNGANYVFPLKCKNDSKILILYFGNFVKSKGFEDILKAISILPLDVSIRLEVHAVGSWIRNDFEIRCKSIIEAHQLPVIVHSPMSGNYKFQMFSNADFFVFTPREPEGHPWVIVEAMAAGLPIITTDQGAITESVINGVNGFIVEPGNPKQIAEKIGILMNSPELKKMMGKESRCLYLKNFTEEKMVERMSVVFNSVLNQ
jgi:glycosyltransferase involved in cell wall biosynthesis